MVSIIKFGSLSNQPSRVRLRLRCSIPENQGEKNIPPCLKTVSAGKLYIKQTPLGVKRGNSLREQLGYMGIM